MIEYTIPGYPDCKISIGINKSMRVSIGGVIYTEGEVYDVYEGDDYLGRFKVEIVSHGVKLVRVKEQANG